MWRCFPLLVVLTAIVAGCGNGAGPLTWPKDAGTTEIGLPVTPHQLAVTAIPHRGLASQILLLGVRPEFAQDADGLTIRYAASTSPRALEIGGARGWSPKGWSLHPLAGFVVPPRTGFAVVVGAASAKRGVHFIRGFVVDYRVGGTTYHAVQQVGLKVCVGLKTCP
ncbi:MAG: hypothetical protein ACRDLM_01670 [Gaiellaceae bacterium]